MSKYDQNSLENCWKKTIALKFTRNCPKKATQSQLLENEANFQLEKCTKNDPPLQCLNP